MIKCGNGERSEHYRYIVIMLWLVFAKGQLSTAETTVESLLHRLSEAPSCTIYEKDTGAQVKQLPNTGTGLILGVKRSSPNRFKKYLCL